MRAVSVKGYAKLNLTLDLVGREAGYHLLDSLVCTIDLFDLVKIKKRKDTQVTVKMHGMGCERLPLEKNNAYRAALAFMQAFHTTGVDVVIYKNIPVGSGLGGSSADVSALLKGMAKLYGVTDSFAVKGVADSLGSDTGYLLSGGFARMQGRGEKVQPLGECPPLYFMLILPPDGVSTPQCYQKSDEMPPLPPVTEEALSRLNAGDLAGACALFSNHLTPSAQALNGEVSTALDEAKSFSPLGYSMTGSGSGVFLCFDSDMMTAWAKSRYKGKFDTVCVRAITPKDKGCGSPYSIEE